MNQGRNEIPNGNKFMKSIHTSRNYKQFQQSLVFAACSSFDPARTNVLSRFLARMLPGLLPAPDGGYPGGNTAEGQARPFEPHDRRI